MQRREFIAWLGGAAAAAALWPLAAGAAERVRRVGMLVGSTEDKVSQARIAEFRDGLAKLGWVEGRDLRIDLRFGRGNPEVMRDFGAELVSLAPDAIVTEGRRATVAVQARTQTIPIVITAVGDPNGIVSNIARPEGNITGITNLVASIGGKWLQLLKEAAPRMERVAVIHDSRFAGAAGPNAYGGSIDNAARVLGVKAIEAPYRDAVDLVRAIDAFAAEPNGGLIVLPPPPTAAIRETILRLATQYRLPAIYQTRSDADEGGLMSYGSDLADNYRRASYFVDRILRGTKVSELPVEFPTKFELVINLQTAKALGLEISPRLLALTNDVIE
jgi:putative ABC transport system substrate-binding protein